MLAFSVWNAIWVVFVAFLWISVLIVFFNVKCHKVQALGVGIEALEASVASLVGMGVLDHPITVRKIHSDVTIWLVCTERSDGDTRTGDETGIRVIDI